MMQKLEPNIVGLKPIKIGQVDWVNVTNSLPLLQRILELCSPGTKW